MAGMSTVRYRIVLEELSPQADAERVSRILEKILPAPPSDLAGAMPVEIPRRFDFRAASEWMDALGRAGIRARVDVQVDGASGFGEADADFAPGVVGQANDEVLPSHPWVLWRQLIEAPEALLTRMPDEARGRAVLLGWVLLTIGGVLGLPGQMWWLSKLSPELGAGPPLQLWWALILLEPLGALLAWTLGTWLVARLGGLGVGFAEAAALAGLAQAFQPLRAIPLLGSILAAFGAFWLIGTGLALRYDLSPRRLLGILLLPPAALLLLFGLLAFGLLILLGDGLGNLLRSFA